MPLVDQPRRPRLRGRARLGGGRCTSDPVGKTILRSRHASGWITSGRPRRPYRAKQGFQAAVVVGMTVGDHDRAQFPDRHLEHVQVAAQARRASCPRRRELSFVGPPRLDGDQRSEPMLGDQLLAAAETVGEVPPHIVGCRPARDRRSCRPAASPRRRRPARALKPRRCSASPASRLSLARYAAGSGPM